MICGSGALSAPPPGAAERAWARRTEAYVADLLSAYDATGVLLVAQRGHILVERVFDDDSETTPALHVDSRFRIGSVVKLWTALALVRASASDDALSLDDSLSRWLPEARHWAPIRLRFLLEHRSGMPRSADAGRLPRTPREATERCAKAPLRFEPGTDEHYSNCGYAVAARVLELHSGRPLATVMRERVLKPLRMKDSGIAMPGEDTPPVAVGYLKREGRSVAVAKAESFGGYSTARDLCTFAMHAPAHGGDEYASLFSSYAGHTEGFDSYFVVDQDQQRVIVLLSNHSDTKVARTFSDLKALLAGDVVPSPKNEGLELLADRPAEGARLVGRYRLEIDRAQVITVEQDAAGLLLLTPDGERARLRWVAPNRLMPVPLGHTSPTAKGDTFLEYAPGEGPIESFTMFVLGGMQTQATRVAETPRPGS